MMDMNTHDIAYALRKYGANTSSIGRAVRFLSAFQDEVNAHSDGWAYWKAPVKAAERLMYMIQIYTPSAPDYITAEQFRLALIPIKSFYTRKGLAAGMKFPEVV